MTEWIVILPWFGSGCACREAVDSKGGRTSSAACVDNSRISSLRQEISEGCVDLEVFWGLKCKNE